MSKPTPLAVQQRHAKKFKSGTKVIVQDDDGNNVPAVIDGEPWCLGGHTYVANCDGDNGKRFRAFMIMRIQPAVS